jgi:hypothetical protein
MAVEIVNNTNQPELNDILQRARRGEDLEKRRERPERLDENFRRRNEVMAKVRQQLAEKRGGK